ncbi:hydroxyethylthiazole kinase [Echinicola vietnamensis]|uniref:Hydroxyethylthiazole kinase n=1 Tax=Echinicola vietnamensis (strain DSM 17526 / LMG 23754 / KMM 6221) TaxID=926556 RepID=L0FU35_ECHVK|nr:hydroxyethylthiazole kinase [Echinicola vietnamensis]AGA76513.1 hydroxyethylthiazole kinase [Echinicola vietnamensis DSM 17526]
MKESVINNLKTLREKGPLVQSITNYVVMNNTANALLAVGASPIMAHAKLEMADMVKIVHALVVNIGTLDEFWVDSMLLAAKEANERNTPWVLDPVGAGATPYRNETLTRLLTFKPTIIRGNASEIMALAKANVQTKGVDSTHSSDEALAYGKQLSKETAAVVCISGETDYIIDGERLTKVKNGHALMGKVTGMGCTATALIAAFAGITSDPYLATVAGMTTMGLAGEIAARKAEGPGTLQLYLYDALYHLKESEVKQWAKLEESHA